MSELAPFFSSLRARFTGDDLASILALRSSATKKIDGSYVTEGDIRAQEIIFSLAREKIKRPFFVSEELADSGNSPDSNEIVVVIDPIDGTENFTSGLVEWGISISCYRAGRHLGSLLGLPEMELWLESGEDVTRHVSRIRALSSSLTKEQIVASTTGYEYRIIGCCVCNMLNVVRGSFYSFENPKGANSWDILAGLNLALEHGLNVKVEGNTYAGEYLPPTRKYRFKIEQR